VPFRLLYPGGTALSMMQVQEAVARRGQSRNWFANSPKDQVSDYGSVRHP